MLRAAWQIPAGQARGLFPAPHPRGLRWRSGILFGGHRDRGVFADRRRDPLQRGGAALSSAAAGFLAVDRAASAVRRACARGALRAQPAPCAGIHHRRVCRIPCAGRSSSAVVARRRPALRLGLCRPALRRPLVRLLCALPLAHRRLVARPCADAHHPCANLLRRPPRAHQRPRIGAIHRTGRRRRRCSRCRPRVAGARHQQCTIRHARRHPELLGLHKLSALHPRRRRLAPQRRPPCAGYRSRHGRRPRNHRVHPGLRRWHFGVSFGL